MVEKIAKEILTKVPAPVSLSDVMKKYPVMYEESMNTVIVQEVRRYLRHYFREIVGNKGTSGTN